MYQKYVPLVGTIVFECTFQSCICGDALYAVDYVFEKCCRKNNFLICYVRFCIDSLFLCIFSNICGASCTDGY